MKERVLLPFQGSGGQNSSTQHLQALSCDSWWSTTVDVRLRAAYYGCRFQYAARRKTERKETKMTWKSKLVLGILTAIAMLLFSFALPRGSFLRDTQAAQFPVTVGVWAIFVLLFVKLK